MNRPLPPLDLPVWIGETARGIVLLDLLIVVVCAAFVADHRRHTMPRHAHQLLWAGTAVCFGITASIVTNVLTAPPTNGIYFAVLGCTVGAVFAGMAAWREYRDH